MFLLEHTATISPNPRWKYCAFTHSPLFCVAGLQQMPPQRIPHYCPAAHTTEKICSPQRFSRTFPRILPRFPRRVYPNMFDRSWDKTCVIIRLMVVRNEHTGVFLGWPWLFWSTIVTIIEMFKSCLYCDLHCLYRVLPLGWQLKTLTWIFLSLRGEEIIYTLCGFKRHFC